MFILPSRQSGKIMKNTDLGGKYNNKVPQYNWHVENCFEVTSIQDIHITRIKGKTLKGL